MKVIERKCLVFSDKQKNSNKFYIAEVQEENEQYMLVCKWGRLGKKPSMNTTICSSRYSALSKLNDVVWKKTHKGRDSYEETDIDEIRANGDCWWND